MTLPKIILSLILGPYLAISIALAGTVSEQQATQKVTSKYQATLLAVSTITSANQQFYKIRIRLEKGSNSGRIKTVYVNRSSGKILDRKP